MQLVGRSNCQFQVQVKSTIGSFELLLLSPLLKSERETLPIVPKFKLLWYHECSTLDAKDLFSIAIFVYHSIFGVESLLFFLLLFCHILLYSLFRYLLRLLLLTLFVRKASSGTLRRYPAGLNRWLTKGKPTATDLVMCLTVQRRDLLGWRLRLLLHASSATDFAENLRRLGYHLLVLLALKGKRLGQFDALAFYVNIRQHLRFFCCLSGGQETEALGLHRLDLLDDVEKFCGSLARQEVEEFSKTTDCTRLLGI